MKQLYLIFCMLTCIACQKSNDFRFIGKINDTSSGAISTLLLQVNDTTYTLTEDSTGVYGLTVPANAVPFANLHGVVVENDGKKWQFSTPLYFETNKSVEMFFTLKDQQAVITTASDKNNQAIQAYRAADLKLNKELWMNLPAPEALKEQLRGFSLEAQRVTNEFNPSKKVAEYLTTWSQISYLGAIQGLSFSYNRQGKQLPENLSTELPSVPQIVDKSYWQTFYSSQMLAIDYLQKKSNIPKEQIVILKSEFKTPSLQDAVHHRIVSQCIREFPYTEENLQMLDSLSVGLAERTVLLEKFKNKRFSSIGAPLPEVVFKDADGKEHRLTDFVGKYIYIDLWASWCGPCCKEVPYLQKLEKQLKNPNVIFISISLDKNQEAWKAKMEQLKMHGNQWIAEGETFAEMLNVKGIPHFLLYGKDGKLMDYNAPRPSTGTVLRSKLEELK